MALKFILHIITKKYYAQNALIDSTNVIASLLLDTCGEKHSLGKLFSIPYHKLTT